MKECFICKELKEKGQYKYKIEPYTTIAITKGKNGKYRCFAWGEGEASIPCNYCPNCGNQLESIKEDIMEEVQIGEYCRTYEGYIGILKEINKKNYNYLTIDVQNKVRRDGLEPLNYIYLKNENIKNHSKIISEIIEVGDYVNGKLIHKIDKGQNYCYLYYGNCKTFVDYQIKTILTKETYEANCYTVEKVKD